MKYYHNTRCSTSRKGLDLLTEKGVAPEIVEYMKEPLILAELEELVSKLGIAPIDLVRTKEAVWIEEFADKELMDEEVMLAMIEYPQLMERPVLENGNKARIGRPIDDLLTIL